MFVCSLLVCLSFSLMCCCVGLVYRLCAWFIVLLGWFVVCFVCLFACLIDWLAGLGLFGRFVVLFGLLCLFCWLWLVDWLVGW